jgi:hypothetical protein
VAGFDDWETFGDSPDEAKELEEGFRPPKLGVLPAFLNQLNMISPLIFKKSRFPIHPFTYISVRNFFIIRNKLSPNFPFDDYVSGLESSLKFQWAD